MTEQKITLSTPPDFSFGALPSAMAGAPWNLSLWTNLTDVDARIEEYSEPGAG